MTELSEALDQFSFHNLLGRKIMDNIPDLNGMTTATIERHIPWLHYSHAIASNTSLKDRTPYFREYSIPFYEEGAVPQAQEIDLGYYDPDLEARYLYRVVHTYYEDTYTSSYPFYQWEFERSQFRHELLKYKTTSSKLNWERPLLGYQHEDLPVQYDDVSNLRFKIDMNSGVGIHITSDCKYQVLVGDQLFISESGVVFIPIVSSNSLTIEVLESTNQIHQTLHDQDDNGLIRRLRHTSDTGDTLGTPSPTYFNIEIKGESIATRAYYPEGDIEDLETTLIHKPGTPLDRRLIPPGKSFGDPNFPTDFWNYNGDPGIEVDSSIGQLSMKPVIKEL